MDRRWGVVAALAAAAWWGGAAGGADQPADGKGEKAAADPAATKLLAEARAARAVWDKFPGFTADVEVNVEGKVARGRVTVDAKGDVTLKLPDDAAEGWARRTLASVVGHRLGDGGGEPTPCAFADDDADHPLGRAVNVLGDEFHSSYRIRDNQILVVNREAGDSRFTITVLENTLNEEKKYLPAFFVVNTWDKADALTRSEAHRQTWKRVGKFDLPESITVLTATAGKQEARRQTLTNHRLASAAGD
jgi:hypothetical protein